MTSTLHCYLHQCLPARPVSVTQGGHHRTGTKEKTLKALVRQLVDLARQQPVMMVFEDAHWIDPTSRELLDLTVERVGRLPPY